MSLLKHRIYLNVSDAEHSYVTDHKAKNKKSTAGKKCQFWCHFQKKPQKTDRTVQTLVIWFDAPM